MLKQTLRRQRFGGERLVVTMRAHLPGAVIVEGRVAVPTEVAGVD